MELRGSKKRRQEILELARSTGLANVEEISDRFSVTPSTVRRDLAFFGTDGVTADRGICEADMQQTRLKELMARRARTTYVLAHAAKIGQGPFHSWVRLPEPWVLVTDAGISSVQLEPFKRAGVKVVVALAGK